MLKVVISHVFGHCFQINQIRDSLAVMGDNSTAFSLPQVCGHVFQCHSSSFLCSGSGHLISIPLLGLASFCKHGFI